MIQRVLDGLSSLSKIFEGNLADHSGTCKGSEGSMSPLKARCCKELARVLFDRFHRSVQPADGRRFGANSSHKHCSTSNDLKSKVEGWNFGQRDACDLSETAQMSQMEFCERQGLLRSLDWQVHCSRTPHADTLEDSYDKTREITRIGKESTHSTLS